ncbi:putative ABC transport system permease protein [Kribbella aluminosa]|uniref:ABC transport system permease protein n=1 Tax=Kribbella aluminosa TaxID=416017 RepID=A0ABS4UGL3_9ACTN|nr:FtsX-like permease family protein [Kribbella aluminosa]MBP2350760.1 putative ABC transport system permease protein [Kribbella aluminosa]
MKLLNDWVLALRLARRTARRTLGRTLLIAALVGLPVLAGSWFSVVHRGTHPTGELLARTVLGSADAQLTVPSARTDVRRVLPSGSQYTRAKSMTGELEVRGNGAALNVGLVTGDFTNALLAGTFRLDKGRMPAKRSEVALSPALADHLGLQPGGAMTAADGTTYQVVGLARTLDFPKARQVFASPALGDPDSQAQYLVDLPNGVDAAALADKLSKQGMTLESRASVIDPPATPRGPVGGAAARVLIVGFGVLELVLLAGTAFAVVARRQTRELGLVTAVGGTSADVRRVVLAQGLYAGLLGAGGGFVIGVVTALVGNAWWEDATSTLITGWQLPWWQLLGVVAVGLVAGLASALVPAIGAARRPPLAALAGRFAAVVGAVRVRRVALALVAGGLVLSVIGNIQLASALDTAREQRAAADPAQISRVASASPTLPVAVVVVGITLVVAGLVWMLPALVGKVAGSFRSLPLGMRLALRDASRHRHRTGPVTAAIMIAVAGTTALAFAVVNQSAAKAQNYEPAGRIGDAVLQFDGDVPYSAQLVDRVQSLLPVEHRYDLGTVVLNGTKAIDGYVANGSVYSSGYSLTAVDPAYVARFLDWGRRAAAELRQGKVVVPLATIAHDGKVKLARGDDLDGRSTIPYPAAVVTSPPRVGVLPRSALISADAARSLGTASVDQVQFSLREQPSAAQLAAVARLLGREDALTVEHGYQSPVRKASIGLLLAGLAATLLGVAMSVALSMSEGRADFATLAAVGAPPRLRRGLAAAQGWFLGQLGCLLGVAVGALYGFTAHTVVGSPTVVVPWAVIAGVAVLVPLFAAAVPYALTRSRLELVRRAD